MFKRLRIDSLEWKHSRQSSSLLSHLNLLMYFLGVMPAASCRASNDLSLLGLLFPTGSPCCPPCIVILRPVLGFVPTAFQPLPA
jgi:hypothetical protein